MTEEQARAIDELAKTEPNYARALSGDNPPSPPQRPKPPYPTGIILIFGLLIPAACIVGFIYSISIFASHIISQDLSIAAGGFWSLVRAVIVLPIAYFSFSFANKHRPLQEVSHDTYIQPPFAMQLFLHEITCPALEGSILTTLEYEIPTGYQTDALSNLLTTTFDRIASEITNEKATLYTTTAKESEAEPNIEHFMKLLKPGEYEASLVPSLGRAIYEAQTPVFRFNVRLKLTDATEPQIRRRGFLGSSI